MNNNNNFLFLHFAINYQKLYTSIRILSYYLEIKIGINLILYYLFDTPKCPTITDIDIKRDCATIL
jgi:hypothetical protein